MAVSAAFAPGVLPTWSFQSCRSSVVEHPLGKGEVECSIHSGSTMISNAFLLDTIRQNIARTCGIKLRRVCSFPRRALTLRFVLTIGPRIGRLVRIRIPHNRALPYPGAACAPSQIATSWGTDQ